MEARAWTAVIVNYNGAVYLEPCLRALERCRPAPNEIVVVDNASTDDSLQELFGFPRARVLSQSRNLGFAGGANAGFAVVETPFVLLMNPDVEVNADFGAAMMDAFSSDAALGAVGAVLLYPDSDRIQHAGGVIERPLMTTRHCHYGESLSAVHLVPADVDFVTGGAVGLRLDALHEIGGFDEQFSPAYYEDVDLCLRLRQAGWRVRLIPSVRAVHHEGVTLQRSVTYYRYLHHNRLRFALKHLTPHEWWSQFLPAELARIRYEISIIDNPTWREKSGATAIEAEMRGMTDWDAESFLPELHPSALLEHMEELRTLWQPPTGTRSQRVWGQLQRVLNRLLTEQRAFNAGVLRALEVQNRMNQQQVMMSLQLTLDLLFRLRSRVPERSESPET